MPPLRPPGVGGDRSDDPFRLCGAGFSFSVSGLRHTARSHVVCDRPGVVCARSHVVCAARPLAVRSVRPFTPCSPVFCLVPVHSGAAHARPSPFISALPVPVCPTLSGPVCPTLSGHIYSCAARRHPFLAARTSRSPHCPSPFHLFPVRGHPVGRLRHDGRSLDLSPRGSIYIGAAENSNGSTTERRLDRQKPGFCGAAGCAGCRSRTGALSSRRRYFCGKLL